MRNKLGMTMNLVTIIISLIVIFAVISFFVPSIAEGAKLILASLGLSEQCGIPPVTCSNCLLVTSTKPAKLEFRQESKWVQSPCFIEAESINITFSEALADSYSSKIDVYTTCNPLPANELDWKKSPLALTKPRVNTLQITGLNSGCYYRIVFSNDFSGISGKKINSEHRIITFKRDIK